MALHLPDMSVSTHKGVGMPAITPGQIRGARAMVGWSMVDLARAADVSVSTVKRVETAGREPVSNELCGFVQTALERVGIRFLDDDGTGPGVRLETPR